jgi:MFS family permease
LFATLNLMASVVAALAPNIVVLFAARCLLGLGVAAIVVAAYSLVADLYPTAQRGRATMVVGLGEIGGAPAAFALGGILLTMAGTGPAGWRWAQLRMSLLLLPVLLLMVALREPPRSEARVKKPPFRDVWARLWGYRALIVPLMLARIMVWIADGAVLVWVAPCFARRFSLAPGQIGTIIATALLISGILGPILGGPLADLCQRAGGPRRTVAALAGLALLSAPTALFAIMRDPSLASILLAVFLTLGFAIATAALTVSTIVIPSELRGLYLALTLTVGSFFSYAVAPLAISILSGALGGPGMIGKALAIVCGGTSILGSVVFAFGKRYFPCETPTVFHPRGLD